MFLHVPPRNINILFSLDLVFLMLRKAMATQVIFDVVKTLVGSMAINKQLVAANSRSLVHYVTFFAIGVIKKVATYDT